MAVRLIEVRQPVANDVIGRRFAVAGFGTGFEGVVLWRLVARGGNVLGEGRITGLRGAPVIDDFAQEVSLTGARHRGEHVVLQVFGDDASGIHPPGTDLNEVPVTLFTELQGWRLYEVRSGDNLTRIARAQGAGTTANDIAAANPDLITDPDLIFPGQVLRVPLFT